MYQKLFVKLFQQILSVETFSDKKLGIFTNSTSSSLPECLSNNSLFWHTDNFAASKIVASCSSNSENDFIIKLIGWRQHS